MLQSKKLFLISCVFAIVCLAPVTAKADDIVITGGTFIVTSGLINHVGITNGVNFSFGVNAYGNGPGCHSGCLPGTPLTGSFQTGALEGAGLTYNGVGYSSRGGGSPVGNFFVFTAPSFFPDPDNPATWQSPFTFTGRIFVYDVNHNQLIINLTGSGIVRFDLTFSQDRSLFSLRNTTYEFQPQPVPEPATLGLLGLGLAGIAARRARRRAGKGKP